MRLRVDGMLNDKQLTDPASRFYNKPNDYAMAALAYYNCFKCKKPYFGGRRDCEQNAEADNRPAAEFICFDCSGISHANCNKPDHKEFL